MSSGTVTLPGGDTAAVFVNATEVQQIQNALSALPITPDNILTSTTVAPTGGDYNWYSIKTSHASITLPSGGQALALQAGAGDTVTGNSDAGQLIIGGSGQDTFNAVGGSGSIFTGDGQNVVNVGAADFQVWTGTGSDTVNLGSGSDTVTALGKATVHAGSGSDTVHGGTFLFFDDTVSGGTDSVVAASGSSDTLSGGDLNDTFDVTGASKVDFRYTSQSGGSGNDTIIGYDAAHDTINLFGGLTVATNQIVGGSREITLSDGTKITLAGYTGAATIQTH